MPIYRFQPLTLISCQLPVTANKIYLKEVTSYVYFNKLDSSTIDNYIKNENVLDKAGAYAIQDDKNFHIIKKIKGDYYNVMGFPLFYIKKQLKKFNFI